jgi:hypothetical protein
MQRTCLEEACGLTVAGRRRYCPAHAQERLRAQNRQGMARRIANGKWAEYMRNIRQRRTAQGLCQTPGCPEKPVGILCADHEGMMRQARKRYRDKRK